LRSLPLRVVTFSCVLRDGWLPPVGADGLRICHGFG
jgi:hypothetical protein